MMQVIDQPKPISERSRALARCYALILSWLESSVAEETQFLRGDDPQTDSTQSSSHADVSAITQDEKMGETSASAALTDHQL